MRAIENCIRSVLLLLLVALISSCSGVKSISDNSVKEEFAEELPQIIFLNYSIKKDNKEVYQIELISQIISEGRLKTVEKPHLKKSKEDLECLTLDKDKRPLSILTIPDPFTKRYEYLQEDGSFTSQIASLDSTVISVRMQLDPASRYVAIKRSDPTGGFYLIITEI